VERYICIHGHFYQPPRENPWLETIEVQDSAYPFHDWNERVTAECYSPNATSRILDRDERIVRIVNNYSRISFNIGPTLMSWMEENAPGVYQAILTADQESRDRFSGHGSALAQVYNHIIMPLANHRDKVTQVVWGIRDFVHRYGRFPEGMWLAETAVDVETLEILAEQGIRFTILAPHQAKRVRRLGDAHWQELANGKIDPSTAYVLRLPSGREISLFFYDDAIAHAVAFEGLLSQGEQFVDRLVAGFSDERSWPQLVHLATDGESYGHHHRFGDMALSYALEHIETENLAVLTNYGEFLDKHPPTHEVRIVENSSWSCSHGVERWRANCGCNTGGHPGWNQAWRAPLREAMDWLRDTISETYHVQAASLLHDPWAARNSYIAVVQDRSKQNVDDFFAEHATYALQEAQRVRAIKMLELQRNAMLMYTSCGWFFDELSGIETLQVMLYAGRVLQLAQELFGDGLEERFLQILEQAKSNVLAHRDGRRIYEQSVGIARVDLEKLCAHYAISSLFESYPENARIYSFDVGLANSRIVEWGRMKLAMGQAHITSVITGESALLTFCALHLGNHNLSGGVRPSRGVEAYQSLADAMVQAFSTADSSDVILLVEREFGNATYSLRSLFRDEQRKVLGLVLAPSIADAELAYRQLYELYAPLMRFLKDSGTPLPEMLQVAARVILGADLRRAFEYGLDRREVQTLLDEAKLWDVKLDVQGFGYTLTATINRFVDEYRRQPESRDALGRLASVVTLAKDVPFRVNLWQAQNSYYEVLQGFYPVELSKAENGDEEAQAWVQQFRALGDMLWVHTR